MLKSLTIVICLAVLSQACDLTKNNLKLVDSVPTLIKTVPNGQKLLIGDSKDPQGDFLFIANLKGTPREMGKAFG